MSQTIHWVETFWVETFLVQNTLSSVPTFCGFYAIPASSAEWTLNQACLATFLAT